MDKNSTLTDKDEAFEFSHEEDEATEYKYASQTSDDVGNHRSYKKKHKSLLMLIGIVIGCFLLYKLYGLFTATHSSQPLAPTKKNVQVIKPVEISTVASMPEKQVPALFEPKVKSAQLDQSKLAGLEKSVTESTQVQENLQVQITGLSSAISEIQNNIAMLTQQMKDFSAQNQLLQEKFTKTALSKEKLEKPKVSTKKTIKKNTQTNNNHYFLKALIHGRAWLMSPSGEMLTVAEGDQLAGYGIIQRIDPETATVNTSSGKNIYFLPQDR